MKTNHMNMKFCLSIFVAICLLILPQAQAVPAGLTFQGRLLNSGTAVESASVDITLKVTSVGGSECTLYEEVQTLNMTNSNGVFTLTVGAGTRTANDKGLSLAQVFTNKSTLRSGLSCTGGGTTYTPSAADTRNVYVSFNDGGTTVAFTSPYVIQAVPYALEADRIAGLSTTDLLQVTTDSTQAKVNTLMVPATYTELNALAGGTSTQYAKPGSGSFTANVDLNSHRIVGLSDPTTATDAANKQYVDGFIGSKAADTTTLTALAAGDSGKVLSWTGTQWTASTPSADSTKLPLAGGTMSGAIAMGGNAITNAGSVTQGAGKYVQIGSFDNTAEGGLTPSLTAAYKGSTWYNSDAAELKFWNGSALKTVVSKNSTGDFAANDVTVNKTVAAYGAVFNDSGSNTVTIRAPSAVTTSYVLRWPAATGAGDAGKVLSTDASGNLSWIAAATGSVTGVSATAPLAASAGTTPTISITKADASTDGYLASADFTTFNNKQSKALTNTHLWVGNGSGVATDVAVSGDATLANTGAVTVTALQGKAVSATVPTLAGQVLRYDGTSWTANFPALFDLRSTVIATNTVFPNTACTTAQTLQWSSITDTLTCNSIGIADSQITYGSRAANLFLASPTSGSGAPTYRSIASSDLPVTGTGGAFVNGGNAFGAASSIGNTDSYDLNLKTAGATRVTVASGGNVGIGTTSPTARLKVEAQSGAGAGDMFTVASGASKWLNISEYGNISMAAPLSVSTNYGFTSAATFTSSDSQSNGLVVQTAGNSSTQFGLLVKGNAGARNDLAVTAAGNVGIGTTSPSAVFHTVGSVTHMGGSVGIGTTAPSFTLDVVGDIQASNQVYTSTLGLNNGGIYRSSVAGVAYGSTGGGVRFSTRTAGTVSEKMRIDDAGNVGIGTTSPGYKLDVAGAINATAVKINGVDLTAGVSGTTSTTSSTFNSNSDATGSDGGFNFQANGTNLVTISNGGVVGIASTAPSTSTTTGALTVAGGMGVAGSIFSGATINAATSVVAPQIYGSAAASGNVKIDGTSDTAKGHVLLATAGGNVGIGTTSPDSLLTLGGAAARTIAMERNPTAATAGQGLTVSSGGAIAGTADLAGGDLNLSSGISTGNGTSKISFLTAPAGTGGATTDNAPTAKVTILGNGNVGIGTTAPLEPFDLRESRTNAVERNPNSSIYTNTTVLSYNEIAYNPSSASTIALINNANHTVVQGANHTGIATSVQGLSRWYGTGASGTVRGVDGTASYSGGSGGAGTVEGVMGFATKLGAGAVTNLFGVSGTAYNQSSSGTAAAVTGGFFRSIQQSGTTSTLRGVYAEAVVNASQTVGNAYGVVAKVTNNGTATNGYGVYIDTVGGTGKWSLYASDATAPSYFAGSVGIGTTSPAAMLEVAGTIKGQKYSGGNGSLATPAYYFTSDTTMGLYRNTSTTSMGLVTNSVERVTIDTSGNVGIGTTSPVNTLDVGTGGGIHITAGVPTSTTAALYNNGGSLYWNGSAIGGGSSQWTTSGSNIYNANAGYVGIGTTSPAAALDISDGTATVLLGADTGATTRTGGQSKTATLSAVAYAASGTVPVFTSVNTSGANRLTFGGGVATQLASTSIAFFTAATRSTTGGGAQRMMIDGAGNVGIGTTSPSETLDVVGNARVTGQIFSGSQTITSGATATLNWNSGNAISTNYDCSLGAFTMNNLRDGGTYTLAATDTGTTSCTFATTTTGSDAATVTYKFKPANTTRSTASTTLYTFMRIGSVVYVSWATGF